MKLVLLCSGEGRRLKPLSDKYPKPLVPVRSPKSNRLFLPNIGRSLFLLKDTFYWSSIDEVVIVAKTDFFKQRDYLRIKRLFSPRKKFTEVVNDDTLSNNSVSLYKVLVACGECHDYLIVEGDLYIKKTFVELLNRQTLDRTTYFCRYRQNEWSFVQRDGYLPSIIKHSNGFAMSGISYLDKDCVRKLYDKLSSHISTSAAPSPDYWEDFLLRCYVDIRTVDAEDTLAEYDTVNDLITQSILSAEDIAKLIDDKGRIKTTSSMTNTSYVIRVNGRKKVLRLPGEGTDRYVDRQREEGVQYQLSRLPRIRSLTPYSVIYEDGVKLTDYLEDHRTSGPSDILGVIEAISSLHDMGKDLLNEPLDPALVIDLVKEVSDYEKCYSKDYVPREYKEVRDRYIKLIYPRQHRNLVLCHRDLDLRNIMVHKISGQCKLIDFEYSGYLNKYWDYAAYWAELHLVSHHVPLDMYTYQLSQLGLSLDYYELLCWRGIVDFIWSCWTIAKISDGEYYSEYFKERWQSACDILKIVTTLQ